jgi:DNA-binding response OmpR family regulator
MSTPGLTVLLVDDEPMVRETGRRYLTRAGYACIEADSIKRAVALISETKVHAAILDVRLPGHISGLDLLESFREQSGLADIPVLIMTGSVLTNEEQASITRQRAFLFYKPEGFGTIVKFLDQLTGRDHSH